jgi:hypothetical protein
VGIAKQAPHRRRLALAFGSAESIIYRGALAHVVQLSKQSAEWAPDFAPDFSLHFEQHDRWPRRLGKLRPKGARSVSCAFFAEVVLSPNGTFSIATTNKNMGYNNSSNCATELHLLPGISS